MYSPFQSVLQFIVLNISSNAFVNNIMGNNVPLSPQCNSRYKPYLLVPYLDGYDGGIVVIFITWMDGQFFCNGLENSFGFLAWIFGFPGTQEPGM